MDTHSRPSEHPSRFSLLIGRWHTSSRVVAAVVLAFLAFCNLPGQHVKRIRYEVGHPFYLKSQYEHGWPATYLVRAVRYPQLPSPSIVGVPPDITVGSCFSLWDDVEELRRGLLLLNGCLVLLASLACGLVFEVWRRARKRVWQLHLRDLFGATLVVSLVAAWWVHAQNRYAAREQDFNAPIGFVSSIWPEYQEGGVTWLGMLLGDAPFQFLDRPICLNVYGDISRLPNHTSVMEVHVNFRATTEELRHLANMPRLEALELGDDVQAPDDEVVAELPPLPRLRGLFLCQPVNRCRRIDRLTSLEAIRVTEGSIDDQLLREISGLRNLRQLALNGLSESTDLSFLPSLSKLTAVDFYNSSLSGAALRSIGQCTSLKEVSLYMAEVDGEGIQHLSNLANLEDLDLSYTDVTSNDVVPLGVLKRLRILDLTHTQVDDLSFASTLENLESLSLYNTEVTSEDLAPLVGLTKLHSLDLGYTRVGTYGLEYLLQMKQLKSLRISGVGRRELEQFQAAMPHCVVIVQ